MAMLTSIKQERFPLEDQKLQGIWLLSQAESTEGRSQKALGQTQEPSSTPGTPPRLVDTGWKGKQHPPGTALVPPKALCPRPIRSLGSLCEGVPAHLSSKASPSSQGRRNSDEGTVESLPEEIKLRLHNLYTSKHHYAMLNLELSLQV